MLLNWPHVNVCSTNYRENDSIRNLSVLTVLKPPNPKGSKTDPFEVWREIAPSILNNIFRPTKSKYMSQPFPYRFDY